MGNGFGADVDHRGSGARIQVRQLGGAGTARHEPSAPDVVHFDVLRTPGAQIVAQLAVAVGAPLPYRADQSQQFLVAGTAAHRRAQVGAFGGEQAGIDLAGGAQARARAVAAERLGNRGNDPNLAATVVERVAARYLAAIGRVERGQRPARTDAFQKLLRWHDALAIPVIAVADIHVLNKAHDNAGGAKVLDQIEHLVIVDAALDDSIELDG